MLTVIDCESSVQLKKSNQVQVGFNVYFLEIVLREFISNDTIVMDNRGAVWLWQENLSIEESLQYFMLQPWLDLMDDYLRQLIPHIYEMPVEMVPWQLSTRCAQCPYEEECVRRGHDDVRALPHISPVNSRFLQKITIEYSSSPLTSSSTTSASPAAGPVQFNNSHLSLAALTSALHSPRLPGRMLGRAQEILEASTHAGCPHGVLDAFHPNPSPRIEAKSTASAASTTDKDMNPAAEMTPLVKGRPYGLWPRDEADVSIAVELAMDPAYELPFSWCVAMRSIDIAKISHMYDTLEKKWERRGKFAIFKTDTIPYSPATVANDVSDLRVREEGCYISLLLALISLLGVVQTTQWTIQFYVSDTSTKFNLSRMIIRTLCYGFTYHPVTTVNSGHLYVLAVTILDKYDQWMLPSPLPSLHTDLLVAFDKLSIQQKSSVNMDHISMCCAVPRLCNVTAACRALLHWPVLGYLTLQRICNLIHLNGDDAQGLNVTTSDLEVAWLKNDINLPEFIMKKTFSLFAVCRFLRDKVACTPLLYNTAQSLPQCMDKAPQVQNPLLRRLLFMKELDILIRCNKRREKRMEDIFNPSGSITLQYLSRYENNHDKAPRGIVGLYEFAQISGPPLCADTAAERSMGMRKWCFTIAKDHVISFLDMKYLGEMSDYSGELPLLFVSIHKVLPATVHAPRGRVVLAVPFRKTDGKWKVPLTGGLQYTLYEREIDINSRKTVEAIIAVDQGVAARTYADLLENPLQWCAPLKPQHGEVTFCGIPISQLIRSKKELNSFYNEMYRLDDKWGPLRPLVGAQDSAYENVLRERMTLLWGPPGTGKTHFAAKTMLNLFESVSRNNGNNNLPLRILVTAFTHTAIDEILKKFTVLFRLANDPNRGDSGGWARLCYVAKLQSLGRGGEAVRIEGVDYTESVITKIRRASFSVIGGTTWALYKKYTNHLKELFDLVIIDEASQMPVMDSVMALSCLRTSPPGRLLVVGDTLQLPPIFAYKFPFPPNNLPPLNASVLECLMRNDQNRRVNLSNVVSGQVPPPPLMIKLNNNFRMNGRLSQFTSQLYGPGYMPSDLSRNANGKWVVSKDMVCSIRDTLGSGVLDGNALKELISIRLVPHRFQKSSSSSEKSLLSEEELLLLSDHDQLQEEANIVAKLFVQLAQSHSRMSEDEASKNIFCCTPHRRQRSAIVTTLSGLGKGHWSSVADTVERVQGQERDIVIICMGCFFEQHNVSREAAFLYSKERLNVAISRAKKTCILVYTDAVTAQNLDVIGSPDTNTAYCHLLSFIRESYKVDFPVMFSV